MIGFISNQTLDNVIASDPAIVSLLPNFDAETVPAKKDFFFQNGCKKNLHRRTDPQSGAMLLRLTRC